MFCSGLQKCAYHSTLTLNLKCKTGWPAFSVKRLAETELNHPTKSNVCLSQYSATHAVENTSKWISWVPIKLYRWTQQMELSWVTQFCYPFWVEELYKWTGNKYYFNLFCSIRRMGSWQLTQMTSHKVISMAGKRPEESHPDESHPDKPSCILCCPRVLEWYFPAVWPWMGSI